MTAIFQSTTQAIHFAYVIQAYEASAESQMGKIIRRMLLEQGVIDGTRQESSVKFDGLSALEIRGQCAMIRAAIDIHLSDSEAAALKAKYGMTNIRDIGGQRIYTFSDERSAAMKVLCDVFSPAHSSLPVASVMCLIARVCAEQKAVRPTFQQIQDSAGGSLGTLHKAYRQIRERLKHLEYAAVDKLQPVFEAEGLVPELAYA